MTVTLGFDIEEFDFPLERGREIDFETQLAVSSEGLEYLLELLARLGIRATFYTTANFAAHRTELLHRIAGAGHEIASHDYYHAASAQSDPAGSKHLLEALCGQRIVGYRAPRLAEASSAALEKAGYKYNSSINPTWIPGRYNNLGKPRSVTRISEGGGNFHDLPHVGVVAAAHPAVLDRPARDAAPALPAAGPERPEA